MMFDIHNNSVTKVSQASLFIYTEKERKSQAIKVSKFTGRSSLEQRLEYGIQRLWFKS